MPFIKMVTRTMEFKFDGYHRDGTMCVYGYEGKQKVAVFRGYYNDRSRSVTLYPVRCFVLKNIGKQKVSIALIK